MELLEYGTESGSMLSRPLGVCPERHRLTPTKATSLAPPPLGWRQRGRGGHPSGAAAVAAVADACRTSLLWPWLGKAVEVLSSGMGQVEGVGACGGRGARGGVFGRCMIHACTKSKTPPPGPWRQLWVLRSQLFCRGGRRRCCRCLCDGRPPCPVPAPCGRAGGRPPW